MIIIISFSDNKDLVIYHTHAGCSTKCTAIQISVSEQHRHESKCWCCCVRTSGYSVTASWVLHPMWVWLTVFIPWYEQFSQICHIGHKWIVIHSSGHLDPQFPPIIWTGYAYRFATFPWDVFCGSALTLPGSTLLKSTTIFCPLLMVHGGNIDISSDVNLHQPVQRPMSEATI